MEYTHKKYGKYTITKIYGDFNNVVVKFLDTGYEYEVQKRNANKGLVRDPFAKTQNGIGYLGVGEWKTIEKSETHKKGYKNTKEYTTWQQMFDRCYSERVHAKHPTYSDCSVDPAWHCFQDFCESIKILPGYEEWIKEGNDYCLDKDTLVEGNKVYGPTTCQFITRSVNTRAALDARWKDTDRVEVGSVWDTNYCGKVEVLAVGEKGKRTVKFFDSGVVKDVYTSALKNGNVSDKGRVECDVGSVWVTNKSGDAEVLEKIGKNVLVKFLNTGNTKVVITQQLKKGAVMDK